MLDWRTILLGVAAFGATFAGGMWLGAGSLPSLIGASVAQIRALPASDPGRKPPAPAPASQPVPITLAPPPAEEAAPQPAPPPPPALTGDDHLRQAVVLRAKAYLKPSCNADPRTLYVAAATKYAEALMRTAGCSQFPRCGLNAQFLNDVWQRNRSPLDKPVAAAMASVNAAGGLTEKSFRGDVGRAVRVIAGREFAQGPGPVCRTERSRQRTARARGRR